MKLALYLGCVIPNRYPSIEAATRKALPKLGVELLDMKGASCCPAPGVIRSFDQKIWLLTAARNLSIAEEMGLDVITLCNGCYASLKEANHILKTEEEKRKEVNMSLAEINREFKGSIKVKHLAEVLYFDVGVKAIKEAVKRKIQVKAAVFYGCHLLKPSELRPWGSVEKPTFLDEMVKVLGAESVPYRDKMMCCGAGGALRSGNLEVSLNMAYERLQSMKEAGAECIVNVCPFCHLQFDLGQRQISMKLGENFDIPVIYYTQLLGLAMGFNPEELGFHMNETRCKSLIERIGI
jgi:heterodisulfide reductase subunit B